jgi:hypothetical protein
MLAGIKIISKSCPCARTWNVPPVMGTVKVSLSHWGIFKYILPWHCFSMVNSLASFFPYDTSASARAYEA